MNCESCECEIAVLKIMIQKIPRQDYTESEILLCQRCAEKQGTWEWLLEQINDKYIYIHHKRDLDATA